MSPMASFFTVGCGDAVFSHRALVLTLCALTVTKYGTSSFQSVTAWVLAAVGSILLVIARVHYSLDVLIAVTAVMLVWIAFDEYYPDTALLSALVTRTDVRLCPGDPVVDQRQRKHQQRELRPRQAQQQQQQQQSHQQRQRGAYSNGGVGRGMGRISNDDATDDDYYYSSTRTSSNSSDIELNSLAGAVAANTGGATGAGEKNQQNKADDVLRDGDGAGDYDDNYFDDDDDDDNDDDIDGMDEGGYVDDSGRGGESSSAAGAGGEKGGDDHRTGAVKS